MRLMRPLPRDVARASLARAMRGATQEASAGL